MNGILPSGESLKTLFTSDGDTTSAGFSLIIQCIDDECSKNASYCGNGTCSMSLHGRQCDCEEGFENLDQNPQMPCNLNECKRGSPCGFGTCSNTEESFTCNCPEGYLQGDGDQQCRQCQIGFEPGNQFEPCQDINECDVMNIDCGRGICRNNPGSYSCVCFDGSSNFKNDSSLICGDFSIMYNVEQTVDCTISVVNETALSYESEHPYGNNDECNAEFSCSVGKIPEYRIQLLRTESSSSCSYDSLVLNGNKHCTGKQSELHGILSSGIVSFSSDGSQVDDGFKIIINCKEDECSKDASYCDNGGICLNSITGRQCSCNEGFENQDQNPELPCQDINECEDRNFCGFGTCSNSDGSFSCTCPDNFVQGYGNTQCKECKNGFELEAELCRDINECELGYCGFGRCSNLEGSFTCSCPEGYLQGYGKQQCRQCKEPGFEPGNQFEPCQDTNECELGYCGFGSCSNNEGSFNCTCPSGFDQGQGYQQCQTCESGFIPGELEVVNLGMVAKSWKEARDICSNYGDGNYTLPVPDSIRYHNYISNLVSGVTEIPIGFSDKLEEGNWINIYTNETISWNKWGKWKGKDQPDNLDGEHFGFLIPSWKWSHDNLHDNWWDHWRDGSSQDSEYVSDLTVICVKKEMDGKNGACQDINECNDYDCGQGECKNNPGSYSCDCFNGFVNFMNDQSQICGNFPIMIIAEESDDCTINPFNETAVVYETEDPYHDYDECNAEFNCPDGQVLRYSIQRFEIEEHSSCKYDSLVLNDLPYCSGNNTEPEMDGILSSGKVSFSSDSSKEYAGFSMIIQCAEVTKTA